MGLPLEQILCPGAFHKPLPQKYRPYRQLTLPLHCLYQISLHCRHLGACVVRSRVGHFVVGAAWNMNGLFLIMTAGLVPHLLLNQGL